MQFEAIIVLAFLALGTHADFFRNDFLPVGHVRTDAIITQDCLSDHVHTFYGPPLLFPKVTFEDLRNSDPSLSSGNINENNSLYWHPAVYHVASDGTKTLQESEMTTVYYNWIPGETIAFPPGFRMITPGEEVFDEGVVTGEREMEISISFQSCWDGENLDSADHMSHVAFPVGEDDDSPCPSSHPVRIPRLDFFIRWFDTKAAKWEFADGTGIFHADYVSGWDESFLQSLLDGGDGDVDSKVTFRAGIKHEGADSDLIAQLNNNAVPKADTSCITTEAIDNVKNLPRGTCSGEIISPFGVCGELPTESPVSPTPAPVAPTVAPVDPTPAPVAPTAAPIDPTPAPVAPTTAPIAPTLAPVAPTAAPVAPTAAPIDPTPAPVAPTTAPIAPTLAPVAPTVAPVNPTPAPVASTPAPVAPTAAPIAPTAAPVAPTAAPVASCQDSPLKMIVDDRARGCAWVARKRSRCNEEDYASHCPATCGVCEEFGCSDTFMDIKFRANGRLYTYEWCGIVEEFPEFCTEVDGFAETCRESCAFCEA